MTIGGENDFDEFYFGVDVAYADLDKIEALVDKVADFTNFFVIGSTGVSHNQTALNQTIQYLTNKNLSYSVYAERADILFQFNFEMSYLTLFRVYFFNFADFLVFSKHIFIQKLCFSYLFISSTPMI